MLLEAMNKFQVAKVMHSEKVKNQYLDKTEKDGRKNFFRASELGQPDRFIIYSFFKHQIKTTPRGAHNYRQLENGDYVHERYQKAWNDMGVLISMEERLSSKDDEYLGQFEWEWAGHYDGLLNVDILRAHALGKVTLHSVLNEETDEWEMEVELDEAYANSIGIFDEDGNIAEDYQPITMVADIKTMNPWGFDRIKKKGDVSEIQGYFDQIQFYMYMLNTPFGSIYVENKANNDVLEIQVLWRDLHEGVEYEWDEAIHGKLSDDKVRIVLDTERFFGSDEVEGIVPRLERLWDIKKRLEEADEAGDRALVQEIMRNEVPRVHDDKPDKFPWKWSSGQNEYYDHYWNSPHKGDDIRDYEDVPAEAVWEFEDEEGNLIKVDSRKVPEGVTYEGFIGLVEMGALKLEEFIIEDFVSQDEEDAEQEHYEETALNADNVLNESGELDLGEATNKKKAPSEAQEYKADNGDNAIDCLNCGKQVTYKRLGNGGTKKCPHCKHTNRVIKA